MKMNVLELMAQGRPLQEIKVKVAAKFRDEFGDYTMMDTYLNASIVSMYDFLFRYREPNSRVRYISAFDATVMNSTPQSWSGAFSRLSLKFRSVSPIELAL